MNIDLNAIKGKKILVVGDIMLDTYYIGEVKRISPEAPVPVIRVTKSYSVLGGAANVARNLIGLRCQSHIIGLIGADDNGKKVEQLVSELGIKADFCISNISTITKTRVIGNNQQIARIDFEEEKFTISQTEEQFLIEKIHKAIPQVDVVIISDYQKGVCSTNICTEIISKCVLLNKSVIVDPKGKNWAKYSHATLITPNIKELSDVVGEDVKNDDISVSNAAEKIIKEYKLPAILVTRSDKGISYISDTLISNAPTQAKEVYDVSGAGDTVVATVAASMAAGYSILNSISLANIAAGIVVGKIGTSPILLNELQSNIFKWNLDGKVVLQSRVKSLVELLREQNKSIIFTNGCFDILHKGHVQYLEEAKKLGDILIVGVNSDASVKRLKGESRPINNQDARCTILAALKAIDFVVVFEDDTPLSLIELVHPDILVKGGDYKIEDIVGREFAKQTVTIPIVEGYSTTKTIEKIG